MDATVACGLGVTMTFDGHSLLIQRSRLSGTPTDRRISLSHISAVNYKPASMLMRGYFQVQLSGDDTPRTAAARGIAIAADSNSAEFYRKSNEDFKTLADAIYRAQIEQIIGW